MTNKLLTIKQIKTPTPNTNNQNNNHKKNIIKTLKHKINLLQNLHHPNIIQYLNYNSSTNYLNIFLKYIPNNSIQTILNSYNTLPKPLIQNFIHQILTNLSYLHNHNIIHHNIKNTNILINNKNTIKISNFNISKKLKTSNILNNTNNNKHQPSLQNSIF